MIKGAVLLAVLACATGCSTNAIRTSDRDGPPSQVVYFDDLDIADSADARILYQRIRTAAVEVCGSVPANDVAQLWARPCIQRAIASAISDINERRPDDPSSDEEDPHPHSTSRCPDVQP
jgi:UrcA family protein